jgi:hypothetical protein
MEPITSLLVRFGRYNVFHGKAMRQRVRGFFMSMNTLPGVARVMPALAPRVAGFAAIQTIVGVAGQRDAGNKGFYPELVGLGICHNVSSIKSNEFLDDGENGQRVALTEFASERL